MVPRRHPGPPAGRRIGTATAYRYLHEAITVLVARVPRRVLADHEQNHRGNRGRMVHLWCSGKHRAFGGNIQFPAGAVGLPGGARLPQRSVRRP